MVLKIIRLFRGYIEFSLSGRYPERFINLLNRNGIRCWDMLPQSGGLTGKMFLSDYRAIRPLARRAGVVLRVGKRSGIPFFIRKYKIRRGIAVGAVFGAVILAVLSQFVWDIRFVGAEKLGSAELEAVLAESGLYRGAFKPLLATDEIERKAQLKKPDISWISVNILNNIAEVNIKEKVKKPKVKNITEPCNIKASCDGVITDVIVHSGTCEVGRGSAVAKNSLLVSSVVEDKNQNLSYVHCDAEIMADVQLRKEFKIPVKKNKIILSKNYTQKSNLFFLWTELPFALSPSETGEGVPVFQTTRLMFNGVRVPLGENILREYYYSLKEINLAPDTAKSVLNKRCALYECFNEGKSTVKSRSVALKRDGNSYVLDVSYIINKDIGEEQSISVGNLAD